MPATKNKINCSVCGMDVSRDSDIKSEYKGQTYYFCSDGDKKEFEKRPHVYAGIEKMSKSHKAA